MKTYEKEALLEYLEFHLITLCEHMEPHINADAYHELYHTAYGVLTDIEQSLEDIPQLHQKT